MNIYFISTKYTKVLPKPNSKKIKNNPISISSKDSIHNDYYSQAKKKNIFK